jgi:hypothetical protein
MTQRSYRTSKALISQTRRICSKNTVLNFYAVCRASSGNARSAQPREDETYVNFVS